MDLGLKGKVAIITGAGSPIGFGRGIAVTLAKEGCSVRSRDNGDQGSQDLDKFIKSLVKEIEAKK